MSRFLGIFFLLVFAVVIGGGLWLMFVTPQAPVQEVTHTLDTATVLK
jgi:hypothetical protein